MILSVVAASEEEDIINNLIRVKPNTSLRVMKDQIVDSVAANPEWLKLRMKDGGTALHEAAKYGQLHVVDALLEANIEINALDNRGRTALHYAILCSHEDRSPHSICPSSSMNENHEDYLVAKHHTAIAHNLLAHGAYHSTRDKNGWTPLHLAAINGFPDMVKELGEGHGVDINEKCLHEWSSLHYAALYGRIDTIKELIRLGANVDVIDHSKYTPVMRACEAREAESALLLLRNKANYTFKANGVSLRKICEEKKVWPVVDYIDKITGLKNEL